MKPLEDLDIEQLSQECFRISSEHGFQDAFAPTSAAISEKLMLAVGELAEAQEELRKGLLPEVVYSVRDGQTFMFANLAAYDGVDKPEGFGIELVDAVIRILDLMAALDLPVRELFAAKMRFNEGRPYLHGKTF